MTKKAPTLRDQFLRDTIKQLQIDNKFFNERMNTLEKRLDFMQDETAKIAVEEQAFIKGASVIMKIANDLLDKQDKTKEPSSKNYPSQAYQ